MIDSKNGISILETSLKEFKNKKAGEDLFPGFFNAINKAIDSVQKAMSTGRKIDEMLRILEAEDSIIVIFFHPESEILFCSISDADDDASLLKDVMRKIATRFWKKHRTDLKVFRSTTDKSKFKSLIADIENLPMGGKVAELFPKLLVAEGVLDKILSMGLINDFDHNIAVNCDGKSSPIKIAKGLFEDRLKIHESLLKLKNLDIISF